MRKLLLAMTAAVVVAVVVPSTASATTFTACGGASNSPQQMVAKWRALGVMHDGSRLIRSGGFSSIDFPSINMLIAQRAVSAPLAQATIVPNTACGGGQMVSFGSRLRPAGYPMSVMLPARFSKSDLCSHRGRGCREITVKAFAFGQLLCGNGTHKVVPVKIIVKVIVIHHPPKPAPPCNCVAPPPVVIPPVIIPPSTCSVVVVGNGNNVNVSQCNITVTIICSGVNVVFGGPDQNSVNEAVNQYEQSHNCNTPPPPTQIHVCLIKQAFLDGNPVTLNGGEFGFSESVNGNLVNNDVTNAASGQCENLGEVNQGDVVELCETNAGGFTPEHVCITETAGTSDLTFLFVNKKSTPPPPQPPSVTAQAQACVNAGANNGVVTGTVTNPNNVNDTASITLGAHSTTISVAANSSANFTLSGFAPGTYSGTATLLTVNKSASFSVTVNQCPFHSPSVTAQAQACVNAGANNGVVTGTVTNPNGIADTAVITLGAQSTTVSVAANESAAFSLSGFAPGTYSGTATLQTAGTSATFSVTVAQCPPQHFTEMTCTGFEEISGGGSFLVDCGVSDDNGAPIFLSAQSNDSNSFVSGINCLDNGGQSCPSGGTFEFRVNGINNGSTVVMSSVTVTATANGVPNTQTFSFKVDPSGGGFSLQHHSWARA